MKKLAVVSSIAFLINSIFIDCSLGQIVDRRTFDDPHTIYDPRRFLFRENDTRINLGNQEFLDSFISVYSPFLEKHPDLSLELSSNSDSRECNKEDTLLSYLRGLAVKNYLVQHGMDGSRLIIKSNGGMHPLAPEEIEGKDYPFGRACNRRVEFKIIKSNK
ncbi:MAG TPA: OmpA family protein [Chitinophagales bacterium]|nr:OmpA family protein [Chitinophagales bacterium]